MTRSDLPLGVTTLGQHPGDGVETFVLIHGYGGSSFSWRYWAPRLAERGHVVLVDLKGHGSAPRPDDGRYAPSDQADLVRRLLEDEDLREVTLTGHSLGGGVALLTALGLRDSGQHGRLRRLVIVAGAAYRQRLPPFVALGHHPRVSAALLRLLGPEFVVAQALRSIVFDNTSVTRAQIRGYAASLAVAGTASALAQTARLIVPDDLDATTRRYPELDVPTLLLWGRRDPVVPLAVGEKLHRHLPRSALAVLDRCGHLPAEEQPDASFAHLERFLDHTS